MEPQIRYCKTKDGVSIAYTTYGDGPPLLWLVDFPWSHLQLEGRRPGPRFGHMGERTVVRYDARGLGLSDREVDDLGMEARQLDLEAVADILGLGTFDLLAIGFSGPTAIAFAAAHPDRVSRLVLLNAFASSRRAFRDSQQSRALVQLSGADWEMFSENLAGLTFGWGSTESKAAGEFIRASVTQEMFGRLSRELSRDDVTDLLPEVKAQTLIIQQAGFKFLKLDSGRGLAAAIPNARLAVVEGSWADAFDSAFKVAADFLNEGAITALAAAPPAVQPSAFRTILFTDLVGHTEMMSRLGDAKGRDIRAHHPRSPEGQRRHRGEDDGRRLHGLVR